MTETFQIEINRTSASRLADTDFNNLQFGKIFTDHMLVCDFEDGYWHNPQIVPFGDLLLSPANVTLHYGQTIFEGLKAYKNDAGEIVLFRPEAHLERFNRSAVRMCMPQINEEVFIGGITELLKLDKNWFPGTEGSSLYIRPFMFATDNTIGVHISNKYKFIILINPVDKYYSEPLKVMIENKYVRAAEGGIGFAKTAGNYASSLYPTKLAVQKGYHQLIWTDHKEHKYIEESGTMNIMAVINNTLITPPLSDSILAGITRDSVLTLARDWGMKVEERKVSVDEIFEAHSKGELTDIFGTGTAAVIAHIALVNYKGQDFVMPEVEKREFSKKMLENLISVRLGRVKDNHGWVFKVD